MSADAVDVVVLPESAVEDAEIDDLEALLTRHRVTGLITGIRERPAQPVQFPRNGVHIGVAIGGQWMHVRHAKHHRWSLDDTQIRQYHLDGALPTRTRWWEAIEVPPRSVQFVEFGDGVTLASLVCEDLAPPDEVAGVLAHELTHGQHVALAIDGVAAHARNVRGLAPKGEAGEGEAAKVAMVA